MRRQIRFVHPNAMSEEELELSKLIVSALELEVDPEKIDPAAPLYGSGLGLDSIDILEITLSISKAYGVKLRSDDEQSRSAFASIRSLSLYIQQHRVK
jgi:acyl carrier protein